MAIRSFEVWDYLIFALCLCVSAGIGVYHGFFGGGQKTTEQYYYGNRNMGALPVALSMLVTYQSSIFLLGYPGEMYIYGSMFWLSFAGVGLGFLLIAFLVVPLLHPLNIRSAFEYLELRYGHQAPRKLASFLSMIAYAFFMGLVVYGPALALKTVTEFPLWASMVIVAIGGIFYTSVGGYKAVIWADVFQCIIIVIGLVSILIKGLISVGGGSEVWRVCSDAGRIQFDEFSPDITIRHTVWGMLIANMFQFFSLGFSQMIVQRISSTQTKTKGMIASLVAIPGFLLFGSVSCFVGLMAFAYNSKQGCDPLAGKAIVNRAEQILPYFVMDIFHDTPGMPGIFLAALFSASLSTLSSGLNSLPTITWEDFIKHKAKNVSDFKATIIGKILVLVYGALAIGIAYLAYLVGGPIVQLTSTIQALASGPIVGMFVMGATFRSANTKGAVVGCLTAVAFLLWIKLGATFEKFFVPTLADGPTTNCSYNSNNNNITISYESSTEYINGTESTTVSMTENPGSVFWLYKISYIWYTFFGMFVCVGVGMIISLITGGRSTADAVETKYMFPFRRWLESNRTKAYELGEKNMPPSIT